MALPLGPPSAALLSGNVVDAFRGLRAQAQASSTLLGGRGRKRRGSHRLKCKCRPQGSNADGIDAFGGSTNASVVAAMKLVGWLVDLPRRLRSLLMMQDVDPSASVLGNQA